MIVILSEAMKSISSVIPSRRSRGAAEDGEESPADGAVRGFQQGIPRRAPRLRRYAGVE